VLLQQVTHAAIAVCLVLACGACIFARTDDASPAASTPFIVAGHFQYLPLVSALRRRLHMAATAPVPCLTFIRRPVERLLSFYGWFVQHTGEAPRLEVGANLH
jgi:hypothetical protein